MISLFSIGKLTVCSYNSFPLLTPSRLYLLSRNSRSSTVGPFNSLLFYKRRSKSSGSPRADDSAPIQPQVLQAKHKLRTTWSTPSHYLKICGANDGINDCTQESFGQVRRHWTSYRTVDLAGCTMPVRSFKAHAPYRTLLQTPSWPHRTGSKLTRVSNWLDNVSRQPIRHRKSHLAGSPIDTSNLGSAEAYITIASRS